MVSQSKYIMLTMAYLANAWQDACRNSNQALMFAGVNSHWPNGRTENHVSSCQLQMAQRRQCKYLALRCP